MPTTFCGICKEEGQSTAFITVSNKQFHEKCLEQLITQASSCSTCVTVFKGDSIVERFLTTFTGTEEQIRNLDKETILAVFNTKFYNYPVERVLQRFIELGGDINANKFQKSPLLHLAIENSNEELVKALLRHGADIEIRDHEGKTGLHVACSLVNLPIVKILIEAGAKTDAKDEDGCPPYFYALSAQDPEAQVINYLLEKGACDLKMENEAQQNCLYYAVRYGNLDLLLLMIDKKVEIAVQRRTWNLAHHAVLYNNMEILYFLVKKIFNPFFDMSDDNGTTPLMVACKRGSFEAAKLLLENGAKPYKKDCDEVSALAHAVARNHYEIAELILKSTKRTLNDYPFLSNPPLFIALERKHFRMAELLLNNRADFTLKCIKGLNIVEFICTRDVLKEGLELLLKKTKLSFENFMKRYAPDTKSLIFLACSNGAANSVKALIELGYDLKEKDSKLNSVLHLACKSEDENIELTDLLLNNGLDPLERNIDNETPLMFAVHNTSVLKRILESCPNPVEVERPGDIDLPIGYIARASLTNSIESMKLLIDHGADVNIPIREGITAMHVACQFKSLAMIELLIKSGFEINKPFRSRPGVTPTYPILFALSLGDNDVVTKMVENGASLEIVKEWAARKFTQSKA